MTPQTLATFVPTLPSAVPLLAILLLAVAVLVAAGLTERGRNKRLKLRLLRVQGRRHTGGAPGQVASIRRATSDSGISILDRVIRHGLPRRQELRRRLERAGLEISLGVYLLAGFLVGLLGFVAGTWSGVMPAAASVLVGLACGFGVPHLVTNQLAKRRQRKFIANFPEAIDLMTRGLKAGLPITECLVAAGEEIADPVGSEFRRVTDALRLGRKLEDVLWETSQRLDLQEFKFFTISLSIQRETGGNLTETLANLSNVLRGRRQLKLKVKALSSEAKTSAYIIGSLPFVMALIIYMMNADYLTPLVTDFRGKVMVALGLLSFLVGAVVMFKMVRFET